MPTPSLLTPFERRGVRFPNRIVVSPMQMYLARDARASDWQFQHLAKYAAGGAGCVFTEVLVREFAGRGVEIIDCSSRGVRGAISPRETPALAATAQPLEPRPPGHRDRTGEAAEVAVHPEVVEVTDRTPHERRVRCPNR